MARSRPKSRPVFDAQSPERTRVAALRSLIGPDVVGALQVGREYPGRRPIADDELTTHFAGEIAIALRVGNGKGRSRLLAIDVDARAPLRIPAIVDELRRRGYGDATLVTDGSAPDRGKVLVFFCREQQGGALRQLASDVLRVARDGVAWGIETPGDIAIFPTRGEGGLIRIGGRNIARTGPLEGFWNAWGEPADLSTIAPSPTRLRAVQDPRVPVRTTPRQRWVDRLMREGITWIAAGGTRGINKIVNRLAHEVVRTHGTGQAGCNEFARILEVIAQASPDLLRPSPTRRDRRHPLAWGRRAGTAWRHVCASHTQVDTTSSDPAGDVVSTSHTVSHVVREVVALLRTLVERRGLNPIAFEVSYRELGAMLGISQEAARQRVLRAEQLRLVARVDPGLPGTGGKYTGRPGGGAKTIYALAYRGESLDEVFVAAEHHHAVRRRRAFVQAERERFERLRAERRAKNVIPLSIHRPDGSAEELLAYARARLRPQAQTLVQETLLDVTRPP